MVVDFKIRPVKEKDVVEIQKMLLNRRFEMFNHFHMTKVICNYKIQVYKDYMLKYKMF